MQAIKRERRTPRSGRDTLARKSALSGARRSGGPRDYQKYTHHLSMYRLPPNDEVSLEEFELFAVDRLRLLKIIETTKIRHPHKGDEFDRAMAKAVKENMPLSTRDIRGNARPEDKEEMYDERRKDHVSHFILRLAYCKSEELRRWFLAQETELFKYRLQTTNTVLEFLEQNGMEYTPIDDDTKQRLARKLALSTYRMTEDDVMRTDFYKVDFEQAIELVKRRQVFLEKGNAYIPKTEMMTIIGGAFRAKLSAALTATSRALPNLEEDSRLLPMLANLSKQYLGNDFSGSSAADKHEVSLASIPTLAEESFPLCMRHSYDRLNSDHHLKHGARMQFGLFLKGIGLSLEDALMFWKSEFCKSMAADKFDKNYAYNIRHNYGKEGKRQDYTPYSCMKIIMSPAPGQGDAHGCPFRHFDKASLHLQLMQYKVPSAGIKDIVNLVESKHYQLACVKYFEATHGVEQADLSLQHPNQFFEKSRELRGVAVESSPKTPMGVKSMDNSANSPVTPPSNNISEMELDDTAFLAAVEASA